MTVKPGSQYDDRLPFRFVSFRFAPHRSVSVVHKLSFASTAHRPSVSCIPPRTKSVSHTFLVIVRYSWKMCSRSRRVLLLLLLLRRRRARRHSSTPRTVWVRSIFRRRQQQGEFHNLVQELRLSDPENHFRYLRMSKHTFDNLLGKVSFSNFNFFILLYN